MYSSRPRQKSHRAGIRYGYPCRVRLSRGYPAETLADSAFGQDCGHNFASIVRRLSIAQTFISFPIPLLVALCFSRDILAYINGTCRTYKDRAGGHAVGNCVKVVCWSDESDDSYEEGSGALIEVLYCSGCFFRFCVE